MSNIGHQLRLYSMQLPLLLPLLWINVNIVKTKDIYTLPTIKWKTPNMLYREVAQVPKSCF